MKFQGLRTIGFLSKAGYETLISPGGYVGWTSHEKCSKIVHFKGEAWDECIRREVDMAAKVLWFGKKDVHPGEWWWLIIIIALPFWGGGVAGGFP